MTDTIPSDSMRTSAPRVAVNQETVRVALTIYLACYNRPDHAAKAIRSILAQTNKDFCFRISDNSTNELVSRMISTEFPLVGYVKRSPSTAACVHGNIILAECSTSHVMIMHDDDLLAPNYVVEMLKFIRERPTAACYACNGMLIDDKENIIRSYFYLSFQSRLQKSDPLWLLRRWFAYGSFSVAPFPAYIYTLSKIRGIRFDTDAYGQLNDFVFIHQCIQREGGLAWINKPLYLYRRHVDQDSANISFDSWRKLRRYVLASHRSYYYSPSFSASRTLYLRKILKSRCKPQTVRTINRIAVTTLLNSPLDLVNRLIGLLIDRVKRTRRLPSRN